MNKSVEKALQHVGRDFGDVLGSYPGSRSLLPALGSRCGSLLGAHMLHTWKVREFVPHGAGPWGESHTHAPLSSLERRSLRHPMKAPQKVQAGAIPDGWPGQNMALDGLSLLPAHFPKPFSPAPGGGVSLASSSALGGTTGSSRLGCREALSICAQSHRQLWRRGNR